VAPPDEPDLAAGEFSDWLAAMTAALRGERAADVPCDGCTACCTASQFVTIAPDETDTLAHIPAELVFPAPRLPGHVLLGYDERGHCPMLVDDRCTIYEHRPRACRTYDCRVFPAAGVEVDGAEKAQLSQRANRWRFRYKDTAAERRHEAVRAATTFLRRRADELPHGAVPTYSTPLAVLAVELHECFLAYDEDGEPAVVEPDVRTVRVELTRRGSGTAPA
jgi:Fe-S-cluster containining protein